MMASFAWSRNLSLKFYSLESPGDVLHIRTLSFSHSHYFTLLTSQIFSSSDFLHSHVQSLIIEFKWVVLYGECHRHNMHGLATLEPHGNGNMNRTSVILRNS